MKIVAIAEHTFREAVRNKIMHAILGLALVIILCSKAVAWVSAGQDVKVMTDLGLAAITFFGVIVGIFSGANLLYREVDKKTSYLILPKPIRRYEFIIGKYFGLALVLFAGIRERFEISRIPEPLKGTGIGLVTAGLLAISFFAFKGMI